MSAIEAAFEDGPALVTYLMAGDPTLEESVGYLETMDAAGADCIEVGIPFSEPIAEGPTIQGATRRALEAGASPERVFAALEPVEVEAPLLVMTYYNLVLQYGDEPSVRPFVERAAEAGIDGIIVPDLPAEEAGPLELACQDHGLDLVFIVAPTTSGDRLTSIMDRASGFAYVQARLGTTGARAAVSEATHHSLARLADFDIPKAVGFGVSDGDQAAEIIAAGADGVVVGSALVDIVASGDAVDERLAELVAELKAGARRGAPEPEQP
ncbi:MAG: tryptophan synthase subunit alpha [Natrialbaceae archaeon]|nr:tryptophan synthase subunit alpha [Natrialbaceae archaeon]